MKKFYLLIALMIIFFACADAPSGTDTATKEKSNQTASDSGLAMMQDSISQILKSANSIESIYENKARAKHFQSRFETSQNLKDLFNYVKELLNNGETNVAI